MVRIYNSKLIIILTSLLSLSLLIFIIGGALLSIFFEAKNLTFFEVLRETYIQNVIVFTIWQAILSTVATLLLAIPIARALHRRKDFFARTFLIKLTTLSFIMPTVVLVIGIAIIHGRNGWINGLLGFYELSLESYLYGTFGILIGHITFNLPLAIRVFLNRLDSIPTDNWRLASQFGFKSKNIFWMIEFPILSSSIIVVAILIFMMCFTSFAIVLSLGGGPVSTTIEVAIYQALKFDFDISRAVVLSIIQLIICIFLMFIISKLLKYPLFTHNNDKNFIRPDLENSFSKLVDLFFIFCTYLILVLPIVSVIISGINERFFHLIYSKIFWSSFGYSLLISISSGILSLAFAFGILLGSFYFKYHRNNSIIASRISMAANIILIMPPFILITGLFLMLRKFVDVYDIAVYLVILINALMALPFVVGILYQAITSFSQQEMWLCQSLDLRGWDFFKLVAWGRIRKATGYALALAIAMSWGDLGVVALFGNNDFITLPYLLYHNMSNYRVDDAATIGFVVLFLSYVLIWIIEEFVGGNNADVRS